MPPAPEIKGWCPSAHRPMASNDGLLIRAKLVGSRIGASQLAAVAAIAADCGNGLIDLSQRAQLQIRGVSDATLPDALRRLDAAGLLARDAEAERVTNIVAAPLAGLDANAAFDANAMALDLAQALQADERLRALPAKFLFAIDDGGAPPLADVDADIHIDAALAGDVAVRVAGAKDRAVVVSLREGVAIALKLARAFVALRRDAFDLRRMRRLVSAVGLDAVLNEAALGARDWTASSTGGSANVVGVHEEGRVRFAGVAAPFGRWRAHELEKLATLAASHGVGELRLTPWRACLVPTATGDDARRIVDAARVLDLIVSPDDPRLAVVACPGAPECPQSRGETRTHLARLAPLAQKLAGMDGVGLHISGCEKGCARPGTSPVTLVARDGLFDLAYNGRASGAPRLKGLDLDAVERTLALRAEERICPTP